MIDINPQDPRPIWRQIEEGIRYLIARGVFVAEGPVPSVRQLAREIRVNPATVSKAYQRLVDADVLVVRRGSGTFVAAGAAGVDAREQQAHLERAARTFVAEARNLGASKTAAKAAFEELWRQITAPDPNRSMSVENRSTPSTEPIHKEPSNDTSGS